MEILKKGSKGDDVKTLQKALHLIQDGVFGRITEEAVRVFQRKNNIKADGIVGEETWKRIVDNNGDIHPLLKTSKRKIKEIIVHCSATREGRNYTVDDIRRWHKQRGFSDIGYHYVIYRDGTVHNGRDVDLVGAHCTNHNAQSIGICYIGGCSRIDGLTPKDTRTQEQKDALLTLLKELRKKYPYAKIYGHRDFANKACPSFDAKDEYKNI
jgi:N-acetylmuramoyl-L-alanine amidase